MSEKRNDMRQYSAEDIQRYLKGEMSADEMHALETAALDDPFLADAIEGFQISMSQDENATLSRLQTLRVEFVERLNLPAKVIPMNRSRWWWTSAAAAILLIVGVAAYNNWFTSEQSSSTGLAITSKKASDSFQPPVALQERTTPSITVTDTLEPATSRTAPSASLPTDISKKKEDSDLARQKSSTEQKFADGPAARDDVARKEPAETEKAENEEYQPNPGVRRDITTKESEAKPLQNAPRRYDQATIQSNNFSGRVVDQDNKPLANASVQVLQNRASVLTDEQGVFNFKSQDSIVDVQVGIVGFEQRNFRLQNRLGSNNLVLEPSSATLNEVVVSGYDTRNKREASKISGKVQNAVPAIGWVEYEKYLETNKRPPSNNPLMKGEVVVSFEVKKAAQLSDFKIEKGLTRDYNNEAIRLIREGPAWKLLDGRKTRITVMVKF